MPIMLPPDPPPTPPDSEPGPSTTAGTRLYDRLAPVATYDPDNGYVVQAIAEVLAEPQAVIEQVARDTGSHLAWQAALDPDAAPAVFLPWLAQFAGVQLLPSDTEQQQRDRIKTAAGFYRGTTRATIEGVQLVQTGAKRVQLLPRVGPSGDSMWHYTVVARTADTPDPAAAERAARAQKPAGMILTFVVSDDPIWSEATLAFSAVGAAETWQTLVPGDA